MADKSEREKDKKSKQKALKSKKKKGGPNYLKGVVVRTIKKVKR